MFSFRCSSTAFPYLLVPFVLACFAIAAEPAVERFSIPAGEASVTLELFSRQSSALVIYLVEQVEGVPTNAVSGDFAAGDALERLLRGTRLRSMRDEKTGTLAVFRAPADAGPQNPPATVETAVRPGNPPAAASPASRGIPRLLGAISDGLSALMRGGPADNSPPELYATRISPFEVAVQKDTSFRTSSVGSGSRLALNLSDVAASYSVINRQFIDALGITDVAEAASWAPGQTFNYGDNGNGERFGQQGTYVSRGFQTSPGGSNVSISGNTGNQINFYQSGSSTSDAFAIETFDFGRGPNSALFGNSNNQAFGNNGGAGLSGVASSQTKRARADATSTSIQAEIGYWGYHRATLDHNRRLTGTTAVRINLVDSNQTGYQHFRFSTVRGVNLTGTWKPAASTNVSITATNQTSKTKNPGLDTRDSFSGWDGQTIFRGPVLNAFLSATAAPGSTASVAHPDYGQIQILGGPDRVTGAAFSGLTFNGEPQGVTRRTNNNFTLDTTTRSIMDWENFAMTRAADSTSRVPIYTRTAPNGVNFARAMTTPAAPGYYSGNQNLPFIPVRRGDSGAPGDMYDNATRGLAKPLHGPRDSHANWVPNTIQRFKDFQFAVDRNIGSDLYVSVGGDINRTHAITRNDDNLINSGINRDINQLRPDGSPNPHFLDLFTAPGAAGNFAAQGGLKYQQQWTDDQAIRANAIYNWDAGRRGQYTFNLNGNANTRVFQANSSTYVVNLPTIDIRRQVAEALITNSSYHGDEARMDPNTLMQQDLPFTSVAYNADGIPTVTRSVVRPRAILRGTQDEATTVYLTQYLTFQTQARLLDNRLVATLTGKRQFDKGYRKLGVLQGDLPGPVTFTNTALGLSSVNPNGTIPWDGQSEVFRPVWAGRADDYYKLTYQPLGTDGLPLRFTSGPKAGQLAPRRLATARPRVGDSVVTGLNVRDPRYQAGSPFGEQLFQDDFSPPVARKHSNTYSAGFVFRPFRGVSPFVNFSNQTIPPDLAALDMNFAVRRVVTAKEFAFGTSIDLGSKLNFRWNYYRNTRSNSAANNDVVTELNTLVNSRNVFDNIAGSNTNAIGIVQFPANPDYTNTVNNGYEIELTLSNLVRGLRLTANGSAGSTGSRQAERFPLTKAWMLDPDNQETMRLLLVEAGGALDTSRRPTYNTGTVTVAYAPGLAIPDPGVTPATTPVEFALDQTRAVNAYNNAWVAYDEIVDQLAVTRNRRNPSANFFADYTVQGGFARGLQIGAGVQWQGARNAYNRGSWTIVDPANPAAAIDNPRFTNQDVEWVEGARNYQANLNYTWRMRSGNSLRFGLRINNPFNDNTVVYNYALQQPDRMPWLPNREHKPSGVARYPDPRNFRLTATYTFSGGARR